METNDPITTLVLQEFRLHSADTTGEAARIVAAFSGGIEPAPPLLTSIDDQCDVATVRALHVGETVNGASGQRAALDPLVANWQPLKQYGPRITERTEGPSAYYRLAVTESGINNAAAEPPAAILPAVPEGGTSTPLSLLWIGAPLGTYAGLMILLGSEGDRDAVRRDPPEWPLPLSRDLGVRIYESQH